MTNYNPGLHILAEIKTDAEALLAKIGEAKTFFDQQIEEHGLHKVGEVYHQFPNGGFTACVCLTESHLSIHTWPEFGLATFDVYLSNYQKDNQETARAIFRATTEYLQSKDFSTKEIFR